MNTKKLKAFFLCTGFALIAAAYTTPAFAAERVTASGLTLEITETLTINSEDACRLTSDGIIVANKGSADFNITGISYTPELAGYTLVENKDIADFQAMEAGSNKYSLIIGFGEISCDLYSGVSDIEIAVEAGNRVSLSVSGCKSVSAEPYEEMLGSAVLTLETKTENVNFAADAPEAESTAENAETEMVFDSGNTEPEANAESLESRASVKSREAGDFGGAEVADDAEAAEVAEVAEASEVAEEGAEDKNKVDNHPTL